MGVGCLIICITPELLEKKGFEGKGEEIGGDTTQKQAEVFLTKAELALFSPV